MHERTEIIVKYQLQMIEEASNLKTHDWKGFYAIFFLSLMTASTSAKRNLHAKYRTTSAQILAKNMYS